MVGKKRKERGTLQEQGKRRTESRIGWSEGRGGRKIDEGNPNRLDPRREERGRARKGEDEQLGTRTRLGLTRGVHREE
jgi:hypothetical protein